MLGSEVGQLSASRGSCPFGKLETNQAFFSRRARPPWPCGTDDEIPETSTRQLQLPGSMPPSESSKPSRRSLAETPPATETGQNKDVQTISRALPCLQSCSCNYADLAIRQAGTSA